MLSMLDNVCVCVCQCCTYSDIFVCVYLSEYVIFMVSECDSRHTNQSGSEYVSLGVSLIVCDHAISIYIYKCVCQNLSLCGLFGLIKAVCVSVSICLYIICMNVGIGVYMWCMWVCNCIWLCVSLYNFAHMWVLE